MKCHRCYFPACYREGKECKNLKGILKKLPEFERKLLTVSSHIEKEFYCKLTRVEELIEFAKRMEFKRIGIAFCIGLLEEAKTFAKILESCGFEVFSAICKIGGIDKSELNIEKINPDILEASCNTGWSS
ncbi:DUF1847 domain-containing protein [Desulfurobacterium thermolithotrophum]|uniref:DUF1847 domain-containing protein n=1 Tax=Desulfurobacterium thermolithotrophum TaxID=64160 RepID=UPI00237AE475|nr:DUF1847 domain-containing protein [Desulfurobacterium thermolithotrophum]